MADFIWDKTYEDLMWEALTKIANRESSRYMVEYFYNGPETSPMMSWIEQFSVAKARKLYLLSDTFKGIWKQIPGNNRVPIHGTMHFRKNLEKPVIYVKGRYTFYEATIKADLSIDIQDYMYKM